MHTGQGIGKSFNNLRGREHVVGAARHRDRFRLARDERDFRCDDDQPGKSHRLERARGRTDIARMAGFDQHEAGRRKSVVRAIRGV